MIATTQSVGRATVLPAPFGELHVEHNREEDHAGMRANQLAALLALMRGADESDDLMRLAARLSAEVAGTMCHRARGEVQGVEDIESASRQLAQLLRSIEPEDGPGDLLWLAQQLAGELSATLESMAGGTQ
jgi:hypothetical protein